MKRVSLMALATTAALVLAASGCGGDEASGSEDGLQQVTMALGNERSIQYHPYFVALDEGFFEDEGLDVEIQVLDGGGLVMQQLVAGNIDLANVGGAPALQTVDTGQDVVWNYSYFYENIFTIVTPADSGIDSIEDMRGQTIGITDPAGGEVPLIRSVFASAGLEEGDYEMLPVGEGGEVTYAALEQGDVQAYSSSVYDVASIEAAGMDLTRIMPEEFVYVPSIGHVTMRDTIEGDPEMVTAFNRAIAKAMVFSAANPDRAKEIAREHGPELFDDEALAEAMWDTTIRLQTPPDDMDSDMFGAHYLPGFENYIEFASQGSAEEGALQTDLTAEDIVDDSTLEEANNFDHAEIEAQATEQ
jgi:ABC-type nitrate/sulfonate/bicarbonate transport system substrate-binding protein